MPNPFDKIPPRALIMMGKPFKAIGRVFTHPVFLSSLKGFGDGCVIAGAALFRGLGIVSASKSIYDTWKDPDRSLLAKIGTTVVNSAVIGVSTLALISLVAGALIAAPVMGVIVAGASLAKNTADYFSDREKTKIIHAEIKKNKEELKAFNLNFERNTTLHRDLVDSQNEIMAFEEQIEARKQSLTQLKSTVTESDLEDVTMFRMHQLGEKIFKNQFLKKNAQSIIQLERRLQQLEEKLTSAPQTEKDQIGSNIQALKDKIGKKKDVNYIIKTEPKKMRIYQLAKEELIAQQKVLATGGAERKGHPDHKTYTELAIKIKALDTKINKHAVILRENEKLLQLIEARDRLALEREALDGKYSVNTYPDETVREKLKQLNVQYIDSRLDLLDAKIKRKLDPASSEQYRGEKLVRLSIEKHHLSESLSVKEDRVKHLQAALAQAITDETDRLTEKLQEKRVTYSKKASYTCLFLEQNASYNTFERVSEAQAKLFKESITPHVQSERKLSLIEKRHVLESKLGALPYTVRQDASEILKREVKISKREGDLKLQAHQQRSRYKNVFFASAVLGLSIATLVFPPAAVGLLAVSGIVGLGAAISYGMDYRKGKKLKKQVQKEHKANVQKTIARLDKQMKTHQNKQSKMIKKSKTLGDALKSFINSQLENIAHRFVPNPESKDSSSVRVNKLLDEAMEKMMQHEDIKALDTRGQEQLKEYLASRETLNRVHDAACNARADYFFERIASDPAKFILEATQELEWVRFPRARRELIQELYQRIQADSDIGLQYKQPIIDKLKEVYVQAIVDDLEITSKEIDEKIIASLDKDPILSSQDNFPFKNQQTGEMQILTKESLIRALQGIVDGKQEKKFGQSRELFGDFTSPEEDINLGLFERLDNNLFQTFSQHKEKFGQRDMHTQKIYRKQDHQSLISELAEMEYPMERLEAIEAMTVHLKDIRRFQEMNGGDSELGQSTQVEIVTKMQDLYITTINEAYHAYYEYLIDEGHDMDNLPEELIEPGRDLFQSAKALALMKMEHSTLSHESLLGKIDKMAAQYEKMVGHNVLQAEKKLLNA